MSGASPSGRAANSPGRAGPRRRAAKLSIVEALAAAGDVGRDLLAVDWSSTPLGTPDTWPRSLTTIVRVLVSSRFSMWMAWGPELTFFCNEAYRLDTLGKKYPWALGRPASEVWAEIWDDIGPRIDSVMGTGAATWDESLLLFLERSGYVEESYHTFSYSPLTDDAGAISGMLCVVSEETERVVGERRMATLRDLGSEPATGRQDRDYLAAASRHLAQNDRSLPFTLVYLFDDEGKAELVSSTGVDSGHPVAPLSIADADPAPVWPVNELSAGRAATVGDLGSRFADLPRGGWHEPPDTAVVLPLPAPVLGERPYGFLVAGANPFRPLDDDYRSFLSLVAAQLASGLASARAYEAERRRAEELAELDRAKTAFFTNVSHELRTPLTLLLGPAEDALLDPDPAIPAHHRERLEMIARNGERLLKLVNTLLDFSRLESGQGTARYQPIDLAEYTGELASMFESAVERAGLAFVVDCRALPEPVYVDREMWAKVVFNLLSNALKFTFAGSITVRLEEVDRCARLTVTDTGIGIDAAEQVKLFERFHRVLSARARTHEGSGVGLALVAELAEIHGGQASVQSTPGEGSTFAVEVPLGSAHLPDEQVVSEGHEVSIEREAAGFLAEASRWLATAGEPGKQSQAAPRSDELPRVLVVDDNQDMREYVSAVLADGYRVITAADGATALELARADPPDLVLTDVMMPRLDGFGLLAALHADRRTLHIPVVMLSARAGEEGVVEGLEAGADDYLIKPFSARELRARVHANLELDRSRRTREELERSQSIQNEAERLAEVGSWEIDLSSGLMRGSNQLLRMLRVDRPTFEHMQFGELVLARVHPDDQDVVRSGMDAAIDSGRLYRQEVRLRHEDGSERWIEIRGEALYDDQDQAMRLRGLIQDVTDRRLAQEALAQAAAAREAAAREHEIADGLQRSLLPGSAFESIHLDVSTYYQAGVEGTRVGGDWYDAVDLGAGRTALIIGDVAGRGIRAASLMGQLRAAVRAYARLDLPPSEVLELLDGLVCELGEGQIVTSIYAVYDPVEGELLYANAGHLPPLMAVPGEATRRLPGATGPPLGLGSSQFGERRLKMPTGAVVVLYTDGLVERRDWDLDVGMDALAEHVHANSGSLGELSDALVQGLAPSGSEDDIAILIARVSHEAVHRTAALDVPADTAALPDGRRFATTTLRDWQVPENVIEDAALIVSELLTNAIVHGRAPIRLRLRVTPEELAIEVDDAASAMPRKLRATPDQIHGRGLAIVAEISNRWAARADGYGKTVWSTLALSRAGGQG